MEDTRPDDDARGDRDRLVDLGSTRRSPHRLVVLGDGVEVSSARLGELAVLVRGPDVAETHTLGHRVGVDSRVVLHEVDNVVDVLVDLSLVGARGESVLVVDAGKLGDPDGLSVRVPVVVNVLLGAGHVDLVDVDAGNVPHGSVSDGVLEGGEPVLVGLLAHSRGDQEGALVLPRSDGREPQGGGDGGVDGRGHGGETVGLVESLDVLRRTVHVLKVPETGRVLLALLAVTPEGGDEDVVGRVGVSGRSVVPEPRDVRAEELERVGTGSTGLDAVGGQAAVARGVASRVARGGGLGGGGSGRRGRGRGGRSGGRRLS